MTKLEVIALEYCITPEGEVLLLTLDGEIFAVLGNVEDVQVDDPLDLLVWEVM